MFAHLIQDPPPQDFYVKPQEVDAQLQLSKLASTFHHMDDVFYFTMWMCVFFFVLITAVLGWSVLKYRRRTDDQPAATDVTHNTPLEVVWTVIPLILVMVIFAWGWRGSMDMTEVPATARQYKALAKQWNWTFKHPGDNEAVAGEVWLEEGKPAVFTLESSDVLHAFYAPSMRVKKDVVPGRFTNIWFQPTRRGDFHLFCAEYCGKDHSRMYAKIHVVDSVTFAKRPWISWDEAHPEANGKKIYESLCKNCHNIDGPVTTGPNWRGLWGKQETVIEGGVEKTVLVDEAYVTESIRKPDQKKVKGFEKQNMSPFDEGLLDKRKVGWLIEYMKTLSTAGGSGQPK